MSELTAIVMLPAAVSGIFVWILHLNPPNMHMGLSSGIPKFHMDPVGWDGVMMAVQCYTDDA